MLNYVKKQGGTDMKKKRIRAIMNLVFVSLLSSCSSSQQTLQSYGCSDYGSAQHKEASSLSENMPAELPEENKEVSQTTGGNIIFNPVIKRRYYEFPQQPQSQQTYNYFKNLHNNLPLNNVGNCAYVATSALLGYYDSYRSDYFIDEKYDKPAYCSSLDDSTYRDSPCVVDHPVKNSTSFTSYITTRINNGSFVGYLYQLALDLGYLTRTQNTGSRKFKHYGNFLKYYISKQNEKLQSKAPIPDKTGPLVSLPDPVTIIQCQYVCKDSPQALPSKECVTDKTIFRNKLIERLKRGEPEVVAGNNHFCVAYYYDESKDIIYGNMGWQNSSADENNCVDLNQFFKKNPRYYWYGIDLTVFGHSHSNNYIRYNNKEFTGRCGCELKSHQCPAVDYISNCYCECPVTHSTHSTEEAVFHDNTYHLSTCSCGRHFFEEHEKDAHSICKQCHTLV